MTLNPIKAYRQWRTRRQERKDARLRLISLSFAKNQGLYMYDTFVKAHTYYLYLKYGFDKSGVETGEIFKRVGEEIPGFYVPEKGLRFTKPRESAGRS